MEVKGDETVGVCNCSGFNALLMADGTRDWGNGLHQMSLLAREWRRRGNPKKRGKRYSRRHRARGPRRFAVFLSCYQQPSLGSSLPSLMPQMSTSTDIFLCSSSHLVTVSTIQLFALIHL